MKISAYILVLFMLITASGCQATHSQMQPPAPQSSTPSPAPAPPAAVSPSPAETPDSQPVVSAPSAAMSWYFKPNMDHATPQVSQEFLQLAENSKVYYALPQNGSKVYLTFDEGYEQGYTAQILDTLKEYKVPAAFFITGHYLTSQPELVKRMVSEGHQVANHTYHHPDLSKISAEQFNKEVTQLEDEFEALTGTKLAPFLRPPMGNYSSASLQWAKNQNYTTVFWSMAFHDWDPKDQPGADFSHRYVLEHVHPGAIILLHAVSESNTIALPKIIEDLRQAGYEFDLLP